MSHREHATSCHFKWRMPLRVAYATSSGDATSSGVSHREHAISCHFMPLQVAHATSSGVSHREHATSCHFKWRPHREHATSCHFKWRSHSACMPLHATSSGVKWRNRFTHLLRAQCKLRKTTLGSHEKKEWTRLPKPTPRNPHIRGKKCTDTRCAYGKSAS